MEKIVLGISIFNYAFAGSKRVITAAITESNNQLYWLWKLKQKQLQPCWNKHWSPDSCFIRPSQQLFGKKIQKRHPKKQRDQWEGQSLRIRNPFCKASVVTTETIFRDCISSTQLDRTRLSPKQRPTSLWSGVRTKARLPASMCLIFSRGANSPVCVKDATKSWPCNSY